MTAITYTAKRNLAAGHSVSTDYNLETASHTIAPDYDPVLGGEGVAQDGTTEAVLDRIDRGYSITTDFITAANLPLWNEFLDSVAVKESFTFDAYGTITTPVSPQTVLLDGKPSYQRVGATMNYQISFKVRVL